MNPIFPTGSLCGLSEVDLPFLLQGWNLTQTWTLSKFHSVDHDGWPRSGQMVEDSILGLLLELLEKKIPYR